VPPLPSPHAIPEGSALCDHVCGTGEPTFGYLLTEFSAHGGEYLFVGAHDLAVQGRVRAGWILTHE
jgi:hypothetical protein